MRVWTCGALIVLMLAGLLKAQNIDYTKRSKNEVRAGAGTYYPLRFVLPRNVPVRLTAHDDGWVNVAVKSNAAGWMSKNCLSGVPPQNPLDTLHLDIFSPDVSPSSLSAAIRGFALAFGNTNEASSQHLMEMCDGLYTPEEFDAFRREGPHLRQSYNHENEHPVEIDTSEQGIGLSVAVRVAGKDLVADRQLLKYLNMVAAYLAEGSSAYDQTFRVYVIGRPQPIAVGLPGGFIFITRRMLDLCSSEAEVAAVLAHEMVHVADKHGMKELQNRHDKIVMEKHFDALVGKPDKADTLLTMMDDLMLSLYEEAVRTRTFPYEKEADNGAVMILHNTGYAPEALSDIILKLSNSIARSQDLETWNPMERMTLKERYDAVKELVQQKGLAGEGKRLPGRFEQNVAHH